MFSTDSSHTPTIPLQDLLVPYFWIEAYHLLDPNTSVYVGQLLGDPHETSEKLFEVLQAAGYTPFLRPLGGETYELVVMRTPIDRPSRLWIHVLLLLLTFLTTLFAGALHANVNPLTHPWLIWKGLPFSLALMGILGAHEMGHYLMARRHRVRATLPYFIPFPHPLFGTLGAVIRIKSPIPSKNALLDIGAAGPIAGILVAIPVTLFGLHLSQVVPAEGLAGVAVLGDSLLFRILAYIVKGPIPEGYQLLLHPIAFAGWIGFFVTALNLIPIAQLDGGHITYALLGTWHRWASRAVFLALLAMGFVWPGWWTWALFILIFLRFDHPAPLNQVSRLDRRRMWIGILCLVIFALTFTPIPLSYLPTSP